MGEVPRSPEHYAGAPSKDVFVDVVRALFVTLAALVTIYVASIALTAAERIGAWLHQD